MSHTRIFTMTLALTILVAASTFAAARAPIGTEGPYAGAVIENQSNVHLYATGPRACLVPPTYYVTLEYAPASDALSLSVDGKTVTGAAGSAQIVFDGDCTTAFPIKVTGVSVGSIAHYTVKVSIGGSSASS